MNADDFISEAVRLLGKANQHEGHYVAQSVLIAAAQACATLAVAAATNAQRFAR